MGTMEKSAPRLEQAPPPSAVQLCLDGIAPQFRELAEKALRLDAAERADNERVRIDARTRDALAAEAEDARAEAIGYMARLLVQVTMPHSKPAKGQSAFERRNGDLRIAIMAPPSVGLPYGTYPRLFMSWVTKEAVITNSKTLDLGDSLSAFVRALGLIKSAGPKGTLPRLQDHLKRLFCSAVAWTYDGPDGWMNIGVSPIETSQLWWDPKRPEQVGLWHSTITLNQRFFEELVRRPVPIDMRALKALAHMRSPLAIDIYSWLTYRMSYLRRETTIPWCLLELQFGGDYAETRVFRFHFAKWLKKVQELYPAADATPTAAGLRLRPSPTHVAKIA